MAIMNKKKKMGFTLVELLVVVSMMSIVAVSITIPMRSSRQVWESGDRYAEVMQNALIGMDKITRELKHAKQIISISGPTITEGFVEFKDRLDTPTIPSIKRFQYTAGGGNLMYGSPGSLSILTGPVNSLKFTCYQSDGSVPTTAPEKIAVIQVEMTTYDSQGKVPNIPLKTKVRVRMDKGDDYMEIEDYCMYGKSGVSIKNNATITTPDPINNPANIGSLTNLITENNNVVVSGNIITGGSLTLNNGSLVAHDAYVDNIVTINSTADIGGNVNCNGTVKVYGTVSGYVNISPTGTIIPAGYSGPKVVGGVPPQKFFNPLPGATTFTAGSGTTDTDGVLSLAPGTYGDIRLTKSGSTDGKLRLTSGVYYFKSIYANASSSVEIDLSSGSGQIQIFIEGDLSKKNTGTDAIFTVIGGSDKYSKVFTEVHGAVNWSATQGTLFTPTGNVTIDNATATGIHGAIYSGGFLEISHPNAPITYIRPNPSVLPPAFTS